MLWIKFNTQCCVRWHSKKQLIRNFDWKSQVDKLIDWFCQFVNHVLFWKTYCFKFSLIDPHMSFNIVSHSTSMREDRNNFHFSTNSKILRFLRRFHEVKDSTKLAHSPRTQHSVLNLKWKSQVDWSIFLVRCVYWLIDCVLACLLDFNQSINDWLIFHKVRGYHSIIEYWTKILFPHFFVFLMAKSILFWLLYQDFNYMENQFWLDLFWISFYK